MSGAVIIYFIVEQRLIPHPFFLKKKTLKGDHEKAMLPLRMLVSGCQFRTFFTVKSCFSLL